MKSFFTFKKLNLEALYQSKVLKNVQGNPSKLIKNRAFFAVEELKSTSKYAVEALQAEKKEDVEKKMYSSGGRKNQV